MSKLKIIFFTVFFLFIGISSVNAKEKVKVLMIINEGFWAPEYYTPRNLFDKEGYEITVAGKYEGLIYPDKRNKDYKPVKVDTTFDKVNVSDYNAITFAGGNGAWTDYFPNDNVHKILSESLNKNLLTGLLCASTGLLGVTNNYNGKSEPIAKGKHVTGYYRVEGLLVSMGQVKYDPGKKNEPYVVVDENLITGRDPLSSELFGKTVIHELNKRIKTK